MIAFAVRAFGFDVCARPKVGTLGGVRADAVAGRMRTCASRAPDGVGLRCSGTRLGDVAKGLTSVALRRGLNVPPGVAYLAVDSNACVYDVVSDVSFSEGEDKR